MEQVMVGRCKLMGAQNRLHVQQASIEKNNIGSNSLSDEGQSSSKQESETIYIKQEVIECEPESVPVKEEYINCLQKLQANHELTLSPALKKEVNVASVGENSMGQEPGGNLREEKPQTLDPHAEQLGSNPASQGRTKSSDVASNIQKRRIKYSEQNVQQQTKCKFCDYLNSKKIALKQQGGKDKIKQGLLYDDLIKSCKVSKHSLCVPFECDLCDYTSLENGNLKKHQAAKHGIGEMFYCDFCDYSDARNGNLKVHLAAKHGIGDMFKCDLCDYSNARSNTLKLHKASQHGIGEVFNCDMCVYSSAVAGSLKKHQAAIHGVGEVFSCDLCDYSSAERRYIKQHKAVKHAIGELLKCELCDYSNARSSSLKLHQAAKHAIGKLFKCDSCDYSSAQRRNVKKHQAAKHFNRELIK